MQSILVQGTIFHRSSKSKTLHNLGRFFRKSNSTNLFAKKPTYYWFYSYRNYTSVVWYKT